MSEYSNLVSRANFSVATRLLSYKAEHLPAIVSILYTPDNTISAMISLISTATLLTLLPLSEGMRVSRDTYGQPAAAPVESYTAPASAPAYTAPEAGLDLTTIVLPIVILVGLFLLFPSFTTLTSVRKTLKMSDREGSQVDILDKIQDVYQALLEDSSLFGL